jgi:CubicO group peptidase (beta-lactamase class C family)
MTYPEILLKVAERLHVLPDQTQVSLALVKNGQVAYHGLIKESEHIDKIDNRTSAFEIGSVTKAFTGNMLAQLAIEGKVRLDDLVEQFLPFTILHNPPITLGQLALHTSGLPRMPHNFETQVHFDKDNPFRNYTEEQLAEYFSKGLHMDSQPGEKYQYSNLGAGLLSYMISKVEKKPFARAVAEKIFNPLRMENSAFDIREIQTTMVRGVDEDGNFCGHWDGGILDGCLGIISTAADLAKFAVEACASSAAAYHFIRLQKRY